MTNADSQLQFSFMPRRRWWHSYLGRLLWLANSDAGQWDDAEKYGFYRLKSRLLQAHAIEDGVDWQEIVHTCWSCDGTGIWGHWRDDGGDCCYKCNGTGVYSRWYIRLHRYRVSTYVFHVPGARLPKDEFRALIPPAAVVFRGKLRHTHVGRRAVLAYWVLCLLFDRRQLRQLLGRWLYQVRARIAMRMPCRCFDCRRVLWTPKAVQARGRDACGKNLAWCRDCAEKVSF